MKTGFIPGNLDIDDLHKFMKPFRKSTLIRFITLFYSATIKNRYKRYIPLSSTRLNNEINKNYKSIINGLIDYGLIQPGKKYREGSHSNHYGLTDKYYNHKEIIPIILKPKIETNIARERRLEKQREISTARREGKLIEQTPEERLHDRYGFLTRWFYDPRLEFNYELAQKYLLKIKKSKAKKSPKRYQHAFPAVERFHRKDWSIRYDKNGRLHTNLSMMPKKFRDCITFEGEQLKGVDVSNTQPLLLASLCDTLWLSSLINRKAIQVDDQLFKEFKTHMDTNPADFIEYQGIVRKGQFYEHMMSLYPEFSRKVMKLSILKIINDSGTSNTYNREMVRAAFKQTFPTIYKLLELLKSVNYKQSSELLMQVESSRFVVWFTQEFYYKEKNRHIPLYTIHDCFYTTLEHIDYVTNELINYYNISCGDVLPTKPR